MAGAVRVPRTYNEDIDGLLSGWKWDGPITFSFPNSASDYPAGTPEAASFRQVSAAQMQAIRFYLTEVAQFTNLQITEAGANADATADIRIAESGLKVNRSASTSYPGAGAGGDAWFGTVGPTVGGTQVVLGGWDHAVHGHEMGHALGLKEAAFTNTFAGGSDFPVNVPLDRNSVEFTVMSYRSYLGGPATNTWASSEGLGLAQSYMMLDIAALQTLYGADYGRNAGNTVYSWSPTTGQMSIDQVGQGIPGANRVFLTIWDGGGRDTYNFSNYTTGVSVDLGPGGWSITSPAQLVNLGDGHMARGNVFNALLHDGDPRSLIEDAIGGSGDDTIRGSYANNQLDGGPGNDWIDGGGGLDTAIFSGNFASYGFVNRGDYSLAVSQAPPGLGPVDTLFQIERLQFADGAVSLEDGDPLFDTLLYLRNNLDVYAAGVDARAHYRGWGWREGRDPNAFFDTDGYLAANPDVAQATLTWLENPLEHYRNWGWHEGRDPSPSFEVTRYLEAYADVRAAGLDPLEHYLRWGFYEGRQTFGDGTWT
jgi:serralysin